MKIKQISQYILVGLGLGVFVAACFEESSTRERYVKREKQEANSQPDENSQDQTTNNEADIQAPKLFTLNWNAGDSSVYEYEIYVGKSRDDLGLFGSYRKSQNFDLTAPSIAVNVADIEWTPGDNFCFQVVSKNVQGSSAPSEAICLE